MANKPAITPADPGLSLKASLRIRRMIEWGVLGCLVFAFTSTMGHYTQEVQAKAERAAVQVTLGALRTTLVLEHLRRAVQTQSGATERQMNPFRLLREIPENYAGVAKIGRMDLVKPGQWIYDPKCVCVAYRLLYPQWLDQAPEVAAIGFRVESQGAVLGMTALEKYQSQGLLLQ